MKKVILITAAGLMNIGAAAEELANPDTVHALKEFAPPKPIPPVAAQGQMPENQFDHTDRSNYYFVTQQIDRSVQPLKVSAGFYGRNFYQSLTTQARGANFYGLLNINHTKANGYQDGAGQQVDWGYQRFNQAAVLGWVPSANQEYKLTFIHDQIDDDKQPHFQNDAVKTDRYISKLSARLGPADLSNTVQAELGYRHIKRHADNYSLRQAAGQRVLVELERDIFDVSLKYDKSWGALHNTASASYQKDRHNGERYLHTLQRDVLTGYRFGDIHTERYRLGNTLSYRFSEAHKLGLGLSYEYSIADVRKNRASMAHPQNPALQFASPQQIWKHYYGLAFDGKAKNRAFSGELKYDFTPSELQQYSLSLAHIKRMPDNAERFNSLAALVYNTRNGVLLDQNPSAAVVGNPRLKPEAHNFVKFTVDAKNEAYTGYHNSLLGSGWQVGGTVMYDQVKNLIIYDRARGQNGVALRRGGFVTRNVDADIFVASAHANYNFNARWAAGMKATYSHGQNKSDGRALYQMRPLELSAQLDYKNYFSSGSYNLGAAVRLADKQTRGDFDASSGLGIDQREAAKRFAVLDLYAGLNFKDKYGLRAGVNNLLDKKYAEFISGNHVLALSPRVVYAPGRTYWLSLHAAF